jgi:hypothetical protein
LKAIGQVGRIQNPSVARPFDELGHTIVTL